MEQTAETMSLAGLGGGGRVCLVSYPWGLSRIISTCTAVHAGHLTGCGGADPHNLPTPASSVSLGHFSA